MDNTTQNPLEAIEPQTTRSVTLNGSMVTVRPLTVGQIPAFSRALTGHGELLALLTDAVSELDALTVIGEHTDALIDAAAAALNMPRATIAGLEMDEFIACIAAIVSVNRDFFVQRMRPMLGALIRQTSGIRGDGSTPSKP